MAKYAVRPAASAARSSAALRIDTTGSPWRVASGEAASAFFQSRGDAFTHEPCMPSRSRTARRAPAGIVSRIALKPVVAFTHDRAPLLALPGDPSRESDDGVVTAKYGDVSVAVNLGDVPRTVAGKRLAAYGWWITAPGLVAAKLEGETPYVEAEGRRWEYRPAPSVPAVPCPPEVAGKPLCETTPAGARLAVLDLEGAHGSWVRVSAGDWKNALAASPLATRHGLKVVSIRSAEELRAALAAGRTAYFAIVNPYGEVFPTEGAGRWTEMIDAIHD